jgi:hypothetical protein
LSKPPFEVPVNLEYLWWFAQEIRPSSLHVCKISFDELLIHQLKGRKTKWQELLVLAASFSNLQIQPSCKVGMLSGWALTHSICRACP